ncbi:hypothetical protein ABZ322_39520, partial [Streptomyces sp. NPDC006129]
DPVGALAGRAGGPALGGVTESVSGSGGGVAEAVESLTSAVDGLPESVRAEAEAVPGGGPLLVEEVLVPGQGAPPAPDVVAYESGEPSVPADDQRPLSYVPFYGIPYVPMPTVVRRRTGVRS